MRGGGGGGGKGPRGFAREDYDCLGSLMIKKITNEKKMIFFSFYWKIVA